MELTGSLMSLSWDKEIRRLGMVHIGVVDFRKNPTPCIWTEFAQELKWNGGFQKHDCVLVLGRIWPKTVIQELANLPNCEHVGAYSSF